MTIYQFTIAQEWGNESTQIYAGNITQALRSFVELHPKLENRILKIEKV